MTMTKSEREELKTLVNERARLEVTRLKALAAQRLVELNDQLEAQWARRGFPDRGVDGAATQGRCGGQRPCDGALR